MGLHIVGIGTATPPHHITQEDAAEWATSMSVDPMHRRHVTKFYPRVGVRTRHSVLLTEDADGIPEHKKLYKPAETLDGTGPSVAARMQAYEAAAGPLAVEAARRALQDAACDPAMITHVVTVSCSGFASPGSDIALWRQLPLRGDVQRTHVGFMGCHGALNGLRVARAFVEADPRTCVLLCAVELCSLHHQYQGRADQIVANALFADGAAAVVAKSSAGRSPADRGDPQNGDSGFAWQLVGNESVLIPETEPYMSWQIRDHGFQMGLSPQVPAIIEQELRPWMDAWLGRHQLSVEQIGSWAIHPGGPKILQACQAALGLSDEQLQTSQDVLAAFGNMSSPTVLFIIDRIRRAGGRLPCVMLAFGPGLTAEGALVIAAP